MNCQSVREQLSAYFDAELPSSAQAGIERHLGQCDECAEELASYRSLQELVNSRGELPVAVPHWSSIEDRLNLNVVSESSRSRSARNQRRVVVALLTLAASLLLVPLTRYYFKPAGLGPSELTQAKATSISLQEIVTLFQQDSDLALNRLSEQFSGKAITIDQAEQSLGHRSIVMSSLENGLQRGAAQLVAARLLTFPSCECPVDACHCGPNGCNCVACVCQRPDGSTFLVLEQCAGQDLNFGNLPVQVVTRGDRQLLQVVSKDFVTISWEENGGRMTAVGLQGDDEIDRLLASR